MCGGQKKKAEKRVKEGRKRLTDVIQELQTSNSFDRSIFQSRLQEVKSSSRWLLYIFHEAAQVTLRPSRQRLPSMNDSSQICGADRHSAVWGVHVILELVQQL